MSTAPTSRSRGPDVTFPPPFVFVAGWIIGAILDRLFPLLLSMPMRLPDSSWAPVAGVLLMLGGVATVVTGMRTFHAARTPVYPNRPAKVIVTHGVYRYTRNPMYLGLTTLYLGLVLLTGMLWPVLMLPLTLAVLHWQVIAKEERHLHEKFPEEYGAYVARVRRWL